MPIITPPAPGPQQDLFIEPIDPRVFTAASAYVGISTAILIKFRLQHPTTASAMTFYIGAASGNVDMGIFTSTDNIAFTLLASTGSTAGAGTNATQTISLTASVVLVPNVNYWAAISVDNTTMTVGQIGNIANAANVNKMGISKTSLFPLATFSTPGTTGRAPYLAVTTTG